MFSFRKLVIGSLLISHLVGTLWLLTPSELFNREPIYTGDYPAHFYRCIAMSEFMSRSGQVGGYDPYLRAGYRYPSAMNDGERAMQVLTYLLAPLPKIWVFKGYVFLVVLLMPWLMYRAARNFELSEKESAILLTAVLFLWWSPFSISFSLLFYGMANFFLASYLSVYIVSLFYQSLIKKNTRAWRPIFFLLPLVFFVHIEAPVILAAPLLIAYVYAFPELSGRWHATFWFLVLLSLSANLFWLIPELREAFLSTSELWQIEKSDLELPKYFLRTDLIEHLKLFLKVLPGMMLALLAYHKYRQEQQLLKFYIFFGTFSGLFLLTYFGSLVHVMALLQPVRFKLPMLMFLLFPLSMGAGYLLEKIGYLRMRPPSSLVLTVLLLLPLALPWILNRTRKDDHINARIPPEGRRLIEWIQQNTNNEARILLESSDRSTFATPYYQGHLPILLPYLTKREFISTAWPIIDVPTFSNGILFTKDVKKFSLNELKKDFDLYNIGWAICWSAEATEVFMSHPEYFLLQDKIDRFYVFTVQRAPSFYLKGSGRVRADYNELKLTQVRAEDHAVVIKYHWADTMKTDPPRVINRVGNEKDPAGFIEVLNPPPELTIYYK